MDKVGWGGGPGSVSLAAHGLPSVAIRGHSGVGVGGLVVAQLPLIDPDGLPALLAALPVASVGARCQMVTYFTGSTPVSSSCSLCSMRSRLPRVERRRRSWNSAACGSPCVAVAVFREKGLCSEQ